MFGSLFDEDENGEVVYQADKIGKTAEKEKKKIHTAPPAPRPRTNMCGIHNQGATCYLNSLLQTLLFTPEFRDGLFSLSREELGWVYSCSDKSADKKLRVIPVELQKLFSQLLLADVEAVSTADLTESFGWVDNEELQQHDVQELNRILFSAIEKSLVGTSGMDLISRLYHGTVVNQVECLECGHVSEREEGFFDLTVSVTGHTSLESSLKSTFLIPEKMDGNNRYHCSFCDHLVDANKGTKLRRLPPVLTLSLLRFSYNPMKGERYKDTSKFSFPTRLDLRQFRDNSEGEEKENGGILKSNDIYQLLSVVVHKGNAHGGHYHAYVRDVGNLGHWNLSTSQEEKADQVCANGDKGSTALADSFVSDGEKEAAESEAIPVPAALLRDILHNGNFIAPSGTLPLVDLCSKLTELTSGSSWRDTFQPKFGHLSRFLMMHPSVFYFNKVTRTVGLQPTGVKLLVPPRSHRESHGSSADGGGGLKGAHRRKKRKKKKGKLGWKRKAGGGECGRRVSAGVRSRAEDDEDEEGGSSSEDGEVAEGCNWFDFDDASVTAIPASALEAQFSGRESAYMLFYRREGMSGRRAEKNMPLVPEHLAKLVEEKNLELRKQREEYQKALNETFVRVLPSSAYVVRNGGLQKRSGNEIREEIRISADKRWTIDRFNQEILKVCEGMAGWENEGRCLYTCQDTPCGLHLVEPLLHSKTHSEARLVKDVVDEDDFRVFAWNGIEVGGVPYLAGPENEPLLLRILLPPVGGVCHEITHGFSKSSPLSRVRVAIAELCRLPLLSLFLSYEPPDENKLHCRNYHLRRNPVGSQENSSRARKCPPKAQVNGIDNGNFTLFKPIRLSVMSNDLSLTTMGMASGGRIVVDSKNLSVTSSQEGSSSVVVWVEDWTQVGVKVGAKRIRNNFNNANLKKDGQAVVHWGVEGRVVRVEVPVETTVHQLKSIAVKELELPLINYRLRKQEDESIGDTNDAALNAKIALKCPLHEYLVLNEADVHSGSKLVLEEGKPVENKEIWLTFSPPPCVGDNPREFEVIVDKKCSIRELLRDMLTLAHLSGEEWHIRKTKWNGDLGEPLDDLSATVGEESIVHGQHLNLCEKSLPHRGSIRLHLFLCSHPNDSNKLMQLTSLPVQLNGNREESHWLQTDAVNTRDEGKDIIDEARGRWTSQQLEQPLFLEMNHHMLDDLGCLEVDKDLSLDQLKEAIMALCPKISSLNLSSPKLLRLRFLKKVDNAPKVAPFAPERMKFSRVLRNNWIHCSLKNLHPEKSIESSHLTLASLQVHSGAIIGVQFMSKEEELGPHDVVLELCQRKPGSKDFFPPVELIWNNSSNVTQEKCRTLSSSQSAALNSNNVDTVKSHEVSEAPQKSESSITPSEASPLISCAPTPQSSSHLISQDEMASIEASPLLCFKKAVSSRLGLSQDNILLAKFLSTKRDWSILQDAHALHDGTAHDKTTPRTRKKGTMENSINTKSTRHFLANLSDGDIIGVKDLMTLTEEEEANDFSLMDESEVSPNNKSNCVRYKRRNAIGNEQEQSSNMKESPKKSERGIHIRVVDYS